MVFHQVKDVHINVKFQILSFYVPLYLAYLSQKCGLLPLSNLRMYIHTYVCMHPRMY